MEDAGDEEIDREAALAALNAQGQAFLQSFSLPAGGAKKRKHTTGEEDMRQSKKGKGKVKEVSLPVDSASDSELDDDGVSGSEDGSGLDWDEEESNGSGEHCLPPLAYNYYSLYASQRYQMRSQTLPSRQRRCENQKWSSFRSRLPNRIPPFNLNRSW